MSVAHDCVICRVSAQSRGAVGDNVVTYELADRLKLPATVMFPLWTATVAPDEMIAPILTSRQQFSSDCSHSTMEAAESEIF